MFALARIDYSRFRELRVGLYTAMIVVDRRSCFVLGTATRGSQRWIELPVLHLPAVRAGQGAADRSRWPASSIDRVRRTSEGAAHRAAAPARAGARRRSSSCSPTSAPALVYGVITLAVLFIAGIRWTHFAALGAVGGWRRSRSSSWSPRPSGYRCSGLPAGAADLVSQSERGPARLQLPDQPGLDRRRLRRKDRPRRRGHASAERLPAGAPHGLHLRRGGRALRIRRRCVPICPSTPCSSGGRCG